MVSALWTSQNGTFDVGFKTEYPFVALNTSKADLELGSIVFGFTLGFGLFVAYNGFREVKRSRRFSFYVALIWVEILANLGFAITAWGYLAGYFPPGLGVFLVIILCWISQVWCLMFIIVNRLCILLSPKHRKWLKVGVFMICFFNSIPTACIWIPAQLQISHHIIEVDRWWDKTEKGIYLVLDFFLNALFVYVVKKRLVDFGLQKYHRVMQFNLRIIFVSLAMDVMLMGMTFLPNAFIYTQFHPVTYIVKLQIEIAMSRLIIKVARSTGVHVDQSDNTTSGMPSTVLGLGHKPSQSVAVHIETQVMTHSEIPLEDLHREDYQSSCTDLGKNGDVKFEPV